LEAEGKRDLGIGWGGGRGRLRRRADRMGKIVVEKENRKKRCRVGTHSLSWRDTVSWRSNDSQISDKGLNSNFRLPDCLFSRYDHRSSRVCGGGGGGRFSVSHESSNGLCLSATTAASFSQRQWLSSYRSSDRHWKLLDNCEDKLWPARVY
jgi:hypothetical protein